MAPNLKSILSSSFVFDVFQSLVGAPAAHRKFLTNYVKPKPGERFLDLGCGVGATLLHLPEDVHYTGVDISAAYIKAARARFGERGTFICSDIAGLSLPSGHFDHAIAFGVLHHLDTATAQSLLQVARAALRPGKCLVTIDPCYTPDQSGAVRFIISKDRGGFVRDVAGYRQLFDPYGEVRVIVVNNLLRFSYTHLIAVTKFA